jgi:histidinol-phosphate phosphatase family protein
LEFYPFAADVIKKINRSGYLAVVITNQSVIARGLTTLKGLNEIHKKLETELGNAGAFVDAIYFCPHHPDGGFEGEVKEFKIICDCRKPKPGMLLQAAEALQH